MLLPLKSKYNPFIIKYLKIIYPDIIQLNGKYIKIASQNKKDRKVFSQLKYIIKLCQRY
jgi:hypothetical protein